MSTVTQDRQVSLLELIDELRVPEGTTLNIRMNSKTFVIDYADWETILNAARQSLFMR